MQATRHELRPELYLPYKLLAGIILILLLAGALLALLLAAGPAGYRLNLTPSMPLGLWRLVVPSVYPRGATVAVCPPVDAPFLPRGSCPIGARLRLNVLNSNQFIVTAGFPGSIGLSAGPW